MGDPRLECVERLQKETKEQVDLLEECQEFLGGNPIEEYCTNCWHGIKETRLCKKHSLLQKVNILLE